MNRCLRELQKDRLGVNISHPFPTKKGVCFCVCVCVFFSRGWVGCVFACVCVRNTKDREFLCCL